jgi:hypothetical protein
MRLIGNTSGDGSGTDYRVLVNALGELLTSSRAARATLLDNAEILSAGYTAAAHITSVGHSMFIQIKSSDVGEYTVMSSPDNVTYYEDETIAVNEANVGLGVEIHPTHEYISVRNDSPDTLTATILLGVL